MARINIELPNEIIKELDELNTSCSEMMSEMTRAGANKVYNNVITNMKKSFRSTERLEKCLKITKTYKTPSDDGVNTKVGFYGYLDAEKKHPAPLVANAREHGTSRGEASKPFFKKSFKKSEIDKVMNEVQEKYLPKE